MKSTQKQTPYEQDKSELRWLRLAAPIMSLEGP